jgi:hypothetical protein
MKSSTAALPFTESDRLDRLTAQGTILNMYELFVRTIYDDLENTTSMRLDMGSDNNTDNPSHAILTAMDEFINAINQYGANLLRDTPRHLTQEFSVRTLSIS